MSRGAASRVSKGVIRPVQRDSIETEKGSSTPNAPNESTKTAGSDSTDQIAKDIVQMLLTAMVRLCRARFKDNNVAHVGHGVDSQDVQGNGVNGRDEARCVRGLNTLAQLVLSIQGGLFGSNANTGLIRDE